MKKVIVLAAMMAIASSAYGEEKIDVAPNATAGGALDCTGAIELTCGDGAVNPDPGVGGTVDNTYGCTGLSYGGCAELVYAVCLGADGDLSVDMNYAHDADNDYDLFLLGSCNEADCLDSSTGTSGAENVAGVGLAAGTYYVVVDGWAGNCAGTGVHDIAINCSTPCAVAVEPASWGSIKALHQ